MQLTNGDSMRVVSSYWHIIPLPTLLGGPQGNVGLNIWKGDSIADFCSTCGTSPEVELQIIGLDPKETQYLFGGSLRDYMLKTYGSISEGEYTHIDPSLIGLGCE